jgi:hypothetical protein
MGEKDKLGWRRTNEGSGCGHQRTCPARRQVVGRIDGDAALDNRRPQRGGVAAGIA